MRMIFGLALLFAAAWNILGQAGGREIVHGQDYTFERMVAKRKVRDADDKGTIRLVTYVYRPLKNDRHEVVLLSHGSTGGMIQSPKEPGDWPPLSLVAFFVSRGYTVVAPMRRGRGESTGTYVEECASYLEQCTQAQQLNLTDRGLHEALADSNAVIDQVIMKGMVPRESKILVSGVSRGGFLSLMLAADRPQLVKGVINFVGGWHSVTDRYPDAVKKLRLETQTARLAAAAKRAAAQTIWVYAARDPFCSESASREFYRAWREAGGKGEYIFVGDHSLPSGHRIAWNSALWGRNVENFLKAIDP